MRRLAYTICLTVCLVGCLGQGCDLCGLFDQFSLPDGAGDQGINAGSPAGAPVPEFGEPVTVEIISESRVAAQVTIQFLILDIEVRRTELTIAPLETANPIGPDLAAIVRIDGTYANGGPIPSAVLILGTDFQADDVIQYIIPDPNDACPDAPGQFTPGICGCGVPEDDGDNDGTPDCIDLCPADSDKINPEVCGCGLAEDDGDDDGTPDCVDLCPADPDKVDPGFCGCGTSDADNNGNGTPDCLDPPSPPSPPAPPPITDCNENLVPDAEDIANETSYDDNENGIPDECEDLPAITGWASVRDHGETEFAIVLNPDTSAATAVVEPRVDGVTEVLVEFNMDVASLYVPGQVMVDCEMTVTDELLIDDGRTLVIELSGSEDGMCCSIDVSKSVTGLAGDTDCAVRILAGDVNSSGLVDNSDTIGIRVRLGDVLSDANSRYDVSCDGSIDDGDLIATRDRRGNQASCEAYEPPAPVQ